MEKIKVLFVNQEITPYLKESHMGKIGRYLPQGIQEKGREIRTFMPRFGNINERRNQLHEVIRLSGMNLIIDDTDHPLIIKVASIQSARMQIYFIDNEDYFQRKFTFTDKDGGFFNDNDERAIFFCRGVLETVKKLGWGPDIVHCHGWMTSLIPLYIRRAFHENPLFSETRIIYSVYNDDFPGAFKKEFHRKIRMDGITSEDLRQYKEPTFINISKAAIHYADAVIHGSEKINPEVASYISITDKPVLGFHSLEKCVDAYSDFYDKVLSHELVSR